MTKSRLIIVLFASCAIFLALLLSSQSFRQQDICRVVPYCDYRCFILPCMKSSSPYLPDEIKGKDACYPPIAYLLVKSLSFDMGKGWKPSNGELRLLASLFLTQVLAVILLSRRLGRLRWVAVSVAVLSPVFLSSLFRLNPSGWAFALVCVFVCWYNSASASKRIAAACALGLATALKITPCVFGVLYVAESPLRPRDWDWRSILLSAGAAVLLVFLPFAFFGGFDSIINLINNAQANSLYYSKDGPMWGFVDIVNRFCDSRSFPRLMDVAAWATRGLAVVLIASACFVQGTYRKLLFTGAAMAFLAHHDYGGAYLLPALFSWLCEEEQVSISALSRLLEAIAWFLIMTPLQFPSIGEGSLNSALQGESLFLLLFLSAGRRYWRCAAELPKGAVDEEKLVS